MTTRFIVAALLGLAVATAAAGDGSAKTIVKTVTTPATAKTAKVVVHRTPRLRVRTTIVKHVRPAVHLGLIRHPAVRAKIAKIVAGKAVVHVVKRPLLQRQAMAHHIGAKKTIIR